MNEGAISAKLRLKGIPYAAEDRMTARDIRLAQETAGRLHLAHVSTAGSVELIRQAKAQGVRLTAEAAPHHLTLTEEAILTHGTAAKVNPPLRTQKDADALVSALRDGIIDAIATDHAPHTREEKARNFDQAPFGISGFETALGSLMTLVHRQKIELATLIAKLTAQPARIIGKSHVMGNLKPGSPADITIFDPDREWIVNPEEFASKGKNTPLAGTLLKGRVMATIVSGRVVHRASR
ncbi:MAG: amidohydrolase family protein [Chloroflexi bacterium]|nr:amidohydrolase family protein [Chloroflexota bacterium]